MAFTRLCAWCGAYLGRDCSQCRAAMGERDSCCLKCSHIPDDRGVTHGICPSCLARELALQSKGDLGPDAGAAQ